MDLIAYALAKKFTEDTASSLGSLKGAPCTIRGIEDITGGHRVTFEWTGTNGQKQTSTMDVMNGEPGQDGAQGHDGFSPEITITPITGGHRVTITDATHPQGQSFDVMDGEGGQAETIDWSKITNKPDDLVQDPDYQHTDNNFTAADKEKLSGLANIKEIGSGLNLDENGKLVAIGGGGGEAVLTSKLTTSKAVGGIPTNKTYEVNTPLETLFRDMLNPVEVPALTDPSATITAAGGTLAEEGETTQKTLTVNFNRGKIDPAYGTTGNRAGAATGYSLNGGAPQAGNSFMVSVNESNKTFKARVDYAQGEQPKDSKGDDYSTPLPAGFVETGTLTFEIVAALWSNQANITAVSKEALISKSTRLKQFNFPAQTAANPEIFDVPASWTVTAVELLNTLSGQWVNCASEFTITDTTHGAIAYKRYTYNGGDATGARSVRIRWS